ncbi:trace amine-associated receptor 1-like [Carcharodon carcharias]|uniref:trace amine-associated receptor 1-like n=1 Tax=Carcharodon carcharias TaxID=13397 RepID=UPI001B7ECD1F|nr:trace amine-associated receptor 1-like [Carcharodon carcharias]
MSACAPGPLGTSAPYAGPGVIQALQFVNGYAILGMQQQVLKIKGFHKECPCCSGCSKNFAYFSKPVFPFIPDVSTTLLMEDPAELIQYGILRGSSGENPCRSHGPFLQELAAVFWSMQTQDLNFRLQRDLTLQGYPFQLVPVHQNLLAITCFATVCNALLVIALVLTILFPIHSSALCTEQQSQLNTNFIILFITSCARSNGLRFIMYIFMLLIILCTLIGNMLLIISILYCKHLHTPTNYLILSLATSDFLLGCLVMPYSMVRSVEMCWYLGQLFYRYYAVCDPLRYKIRMTFFSVKMMIIVSWAISAVFGFTLIFLQLNLKGIEELYYNHIACYGSCILVFSDISGIVASMIAFYIPGVTMLCIYCKIYFVAMKQVRSINRITIQMQSIEDNSSRFSRSNERKAVKTLGLVLGVFLICWSPFFICNTTYSFVNYTASPVLFDALVWFGYLNSTFNPIIYGFFFSWFRKAAAIIWTCKIFRPVSSQMEL